MIRLSPSKISKYFYCGEAFRRAIVLGEREPMAGYPLRGSAVHEAVAHNFRQKIASEKDLPLDVVTDVARTYVVKESEEVGVSTRDSDVKPQKWVIDEIIDESVRLAKLHHLTLAPEIQPARVEKKIEMNISDDLELVCILDVQEKNGIISDLKTARRAKPQEEADRSIQLTMEWLAAKLLSEQKGGPPSVPVVRLDILVDTKKPKIQQLVSTRGEDDVRALSNIVNAVKSGIESGTFLPASVTSTWKCDPNHCGFFRSCKYVAPK